MTLAETLRSAEKRLVAAGIDTARLDAEILLAHVLGCRRFDLYSGAGRALGAGEATAFEALLERRVGHEPVAYLIGEQEFWSLTFKVTPDTLIPRPDTETLVEAVLEARRGCDTRAILDLGTGTGCILLSLLSEISVAQGTAVDISAGALAVAHENAVSLGLAERATFLNGSWFEGVDAPEGGFDVIVSNPPYIPSADIAGLMPDVREFEPMGALDGGNDGLGPYRLIANEAGAYMATGGTLAVEVGIHQALDVATLFEDAGFIGVEIRKDLGGIDRVVLGKKS